MFILIFFGSVIIFQNFSASYTSFLSVVTERKPFDSLQSLYEDTEFSIGVPEGWVTIEMMKVHIFWIFLHKMNIVILLQPINEYSKLLVENRWDYAKDFDTAIKKIQSEEYAFICGENIMYNYINENAPCSSMDAPTFDKIWNLADFRVCG